MANYSDFLKQAEHYWFYEFEKQSRESEKNTKRELGVAIFALFMTILLTVYHIKVTKNTDDAVETIKKTIGAVLPHPVETENQNVPSK